MGTASITTQPSCDSPAVIVANANYGYHFLQWNDGNIDNPRTVTLTQDTSFTAYFAPNQYTLTVTAGEHGTTSGSGTYNYGDIITIRAYPEEHYHFTRWNDNNTDNPRQYRIEENKTLTAFFANNTYTVTVVSANPTMGTVSGGGQAMYGSTVTIRATSNQGYHFERWNDNNTNSIRTVEVHGNITYTAYFAANVGIDDVVTDNIRVYAQNGQIAIEGVGDMPVWVYDIMGRQVAHSKNATEPVSVPNKGVYLVKVGTLPAQKVVVIR